MKKFLYNRILIAAIFVGLIASLIIAYQRHVVETKNMQIDVAVDYDSLWNLAEREGLSLDDVLIAAKDAGITSIAIYDTNFTKLAGRGKVVVLPGHNIIGNYYSGAAVDTNWRKLIEAGSIDPNKIYIIGHDMDVYAEARDDLIRRIGTERVNILNIGDNEVLEVKAQYGPFMAYNLGIPTEELETAKNFGFTILARPSNYFDCSEDDVKAVFERLDGYPISEIVFAGAEVLGNSKAIATTADEMRNRGITFGLIEATTQLQFYHQAGMQELARTLGYNHVARLYAIPSDEQPKLLPVSTAVTRWASTDHERNIRINLLRIYERPLGGLSLFDTNIKYFRDTTELLRSKGYSLGAASTFENYYPSKFLRALVVIGVAAAIVLYLSLISKWLNNNTKMQLIFFGVMAALMAIPVLMGAGGKVKLFAAFAAANLFPALAIIWQLDSIRFMQLKERLKLRKIKGSDRTMAVKEPTPILQIIILALIALIVTGAMSMAGAAYLSGALSDVEYFLEVNIFRGIKLTFILPLILVSIAFLQRFNVLENSPDIKNINAIAQIKKILNMPVSVKTFIGFIIVCAAVVVLIARSGHTSGMPVSGTEMQFRSFLENLFYARPRSKELLIGHPAFMLAIMAYFQKWSKSIFFILVIIATIGQGSMVETFAHMRTPIFMSFIRGIDGLALGAAIGIIPMVIIHLYMKNKSSFEQLKQYQ
ncbi:MAG: hypothetical protein IJ563_09760 [Selenomonadaceae bacterium]|nr:hypothetical protein [Selenomonadaceae bacterium]MBR1858099.1 hypothetical protein [Selenomonadaceae bacterium]